MSDADRARGGRGRGKGVHDLFGMLTGEAFAVVTPEVVDTNFEVVEPGLVAVQRRECVQKGKKAGRRDHSENHPCVCADRRHRREIDGRRGWLEGVTIFSRT
jgi:hypothetical protein